MGEYLYGDDPIGFAHLHGNIPRPVEPHQPQKPHRDYDDDEEEGEDDDDDDKEEENDEEEDDNDDDDD